MNQIGFGDFLKGVTVSNFDTRFIKFLTLLLILGLMSGLSACQPKSSQTSAQREFTQTKAQSIIGGDLVKSDSVIAAKVIYLALGVEKKTTPFGFTIRQKELCTASALTTKILITAAHCVSDLAASQIYAVLSTDPWGHPLKESEWIQVEKIKVHEKFVDQKDLIENDLALIKLSKEISIDRVSELAASDQLNLESFSLVAVGYGRTSAAVDFSTTAEENSPQLRFVTKTVQNFKALDLTFQIDQADAKGFCLGDSGGPGFIYDEQKKSFYILGITSYLSILESEKKLRDPDNTLNSCIGHGYYTNLLLHKEWLTQSISELK